MDNIFSVSDLVDKFIEIQKIFKPDTSIEVGAHKAEFSIKMVGLAKEIWAFEASPYVYNSIYPITGVNYINKAISNQDGVIKFEIQDELEKFIGNNSIMNRNENKSYSYIDVSSISLNSHINLINDYKNICLWIDCEGANKEVLTGASEILQNVSSIFIEVEEYEFWKNQWLYNDVENFLLNNGFILWAKDQENENNQYNCIFIKKELESILNHE